MICLYSVGVGQLCKYQHTGIAWVIRTLFPEICHSTKKGWWVPEQEGSLNVFPSIKKSMCFPLSFESIDNYLWNYLPFQIIVGKIRGKIRTSFFLSFCHLLKIFSWIIQLMNSMRWKANIVPSPVSSLLASLPETHTAEIAIFLQFVWASENRHVGHIRQPK